VSATPRGLALAAGRRHTACFAGGMATRSPRITQLGLGMDEAAEAAQVDAWWNPPSTQVSCPPSVPPGMSETSVPRRRPTVAIEAFEEDGASLDS